MADYSTRAIPKQVWGYYHPFYGTPEGPTGRWLTWNEPLWLSTGYGFPAYEPPDEVLEKLAHNPDEFLAPGRRSNYSAFYPTLGLYDCLDPKVLEQHAIWALEAGLDGLFWDYQLVGEDNSDKDKPLKETIYDRSLRLMLEVLERTGLPLQVSPWYDTYCWQGFSVERIAEQLAYIARTYHGNPRVLHFDGQLALCIYATLVKHTVADWKRVRALLAQAGLDDRLFLIAGEVAVTNPDLYEPGLFQGFCQYNSSLEHWSPEGFALASKQVAELARRNGASFWSASVAPGFDGRIWHHPGRVMARGLGGLYEGMWEAALATSPCFVTVCSFNEWGEGTQIEPCEEYEDLYLRLTAKWAERFRAGA